MLSTKENLKHREQTAVPVVQVLSFYAFIKTVFAVLITICVRKDIDLTAG